MAYDCLVCQHTTIQFYDQKTDSDTYHCEYCGSIFKDPGVHQSLKAQRSRYDLHENDADDPGYRAYFQRFLDFVLPQIGRPKQALDFGCGKSTLLADLLREQGIACDAYDPLYHPDTAYHSKKYDLIVSVEVFEHLHDPGEVFGMLLERVHPGGYLAIQTQFHENSIEKYLEWYYRMDPTHVVFFLPETFEVLCRRYGGQLAAENGKNMILIQV